MSVRGTAMGLVVLAALAAAAPVQAEVLELRAKVFNDKNGDLPPSDESWITVRVSLSKQVPFWKFQGDSRTYVYDEPADGFEVTLTYDEDPGNPLTFTQGKIVAADDLEMGYFNPTPHTVVFAFGTGMLAISLVNYIELGVEPLQHRFPLALHDFSFPVVSLYESSAEGAPVVFQAQPHHAVPIREEIELLGQANQGIQGLASTLGAIPASLANLGSDVDSLLATKSSQGSVDAVAAALEAKASQASVDAVAAAVEMKASQASLDAVSANVDALRNGVVQVLANQETALSTQAAQHADLKADIASLRAGLDQVLANQATMVDSLVIAHNKLDRLLKNK